MVEYVVVVAGIIAALGAVSAAIQHAAGNLVCTAINKVPVDEEPDDKPACP